MIPLDEALALITRHISPVGSETVPLAAAGGRILAEPVIAQLTQPPFAASAMDGYAVHASDLTGEPVTLTLAGESAAGHIFDKALERGTAIRVSTGAALPPGANQVVMQENANPADAAVTLSDAPRPLAHIRATGQDFARGDRLVDAGTILSPEALSLAAAAGVSEVVARRRPHVGILASGDELVEPGETPGPGQIVNSIAIGLTRLVEQWGGAPVYLGIARDEPAAIGARLASAERLDLLVTVGGASVGDHDHFRGVFRDRGGQIVFDKIAIKPGKPTWFGLVGDMPVIGLPGNPVSAFVTARLVLRHALGRRLGRGPTAMPSRHHTLATALPANGDRETFLRASLIPATGDVAPVTRQDSGVLSALVEADLLIRRAAGAPAAAAGDRVETVALD